MSSNQISAVFFFVGIVAAVPVLYYYYKRNPNPRFRPPLGEMAMITIFALMFVGGGSYMMGTLLSSNPEFDPNASKKPEARARQQQQPEPQETGGNSSKKEKSFFGP